MHRCEAFLQQEIYSTYKRFEKTKCKSISNGKHWHNYMYMYVYVDTAFSGYSNGKRVYVFTFKLERHQFQTYSSPNEMRATLTTNKSRRLNRLRQNEPLCRMKPYATIYAEIREVRNRRPQLRASKQTLSVISMVNTVVKKQSKY